MTMPSRSTENTSPKDSGRLPWPVLIASLISILAYFLMAGVQPLIFAFTVAILASYITPVRLEGNTPLRWWVRLGLLFLILVFNADEPRYGEGVGSPRVRNIFGQFYMAEIAVQCWRRRNDDPNRSSIIAMLVSGMLFLTASNTFDLRNIRFLAPAYLFFIGLTLYRYRNREITAQGQLWRFATLAGVLSVGFLTYIIIFVNKGPLTDWGNRLLMDRLPMPESSMASQPFLDNMFGQRGSAARVLRIENHAGSQHLRGMAFDAYNLGRWSPAPLERTYHEVHSELMPSGSDRLLGAKDMRITRLGNRNPIVYAPLEAAAIDRGEAEISEWSPENGGPIRVRMQPPYEYGVTVPRDEQWQGLLANKITPVYRERCLQLPPKFDPRVRQLAQRITQQASTDTEKIALVINYLLSNHKYSLYFRREPSMEPVTDFLLSEPKKDAHCEYFAASAALLLRCVGVPTRYVTGFYAHESGGENITIVRQRDAHAWAEAWVEGIGWVTVEATPANGRSGEDEVSVEWWRYITEWFQDTIKAFTDWLGDLGQDKINVGLGVILLGGLLYGANVYYRQRRLTPPLSVFTYSSPDARLAALIARFESVYARRGVPFPESKTYSEHLNTLVETPHAETLDAARRFVRSYDETRFGGKRDGATLSVMEESLQEIESKIQ